MVKIDIQKIQQSKPIEELLQFSIINIDKPAEHTSFDVVARIRGIFKIKKTGHFGTLDPMVTGVLPVAINRACKLTDYFMHKDKIYIGEMYLHEDISEEKLRQEMKKFIGKIMQMPPVKSSVKRQLRERTINKFEIIEIKGKTIKFIADVEAGTYIRKLIHDLGENMGGAHMTALRRIKAGIFEEENSHSIEEVAEAFNLWKEKGDETKLRKMLIPAEIVSEILPAIQIKENNLKQILTGKPLMESDFEEIPKEDLFCTFIGSRFIGIYRKVDEKNNKDILARVEFVLN